MIRVNLETHQGVIVRLLVKGHAYAGDPGFDLVCSGVSSIMTGGLNACDQLGTAQDWSYEVREGKSPLIRIDINQNSGDLQIVLKTLLIQLKTVEEEFSQYIVIKETEV